MVGLVRDYLVIYVNGRRYEVRGSPAFQSLSSFLRYELGLTGTKIVCAEGDCGSCAVLLGRAGEAGMVYRPITSCIQFLYQLDAAHIVTIEGLLYDGQLNPVQEAFVRCQGAQCGFCTPGFIVSLCGMREANEPLTDQTMRAGLSGNLCRCTGYESILQSGLEASAETMKRIDDLYPPMEMLATLRTLARESVRIVSASTGREFFKPTTPPAAAAYKAANPNCTIIAGGTDIGVQINKGLRDPAVVMSLAGLSELNGILVDNSVILAGALATLSDLERKAEEVSPEFAKMLWRHGSPLIRNAGTLAGNIANASPIGDSMPALFVLNALIELTGRSGTRQVNINDFYTGYRQTVMAADELITLVIIALPRPGDDFRLYKISKRHDLDISTFTAAFWMRREDNVIADLRIAYGGVGPVIYRLRKTEAALIGKPFTETEIEAATEIARSEITPISDVRGDAEYRFLLAENILRKFYFDITGVETYQRTTDPGRIAAYAATLPTSANGDGDGSDGTDGNDGNGEAR
jgi:xanthine dehydrogenase small subunit